MVAATGIISGLAERIGAESITTQPTRDEVQTAWVAPARLREALEWLKSPRGGSCAMLLDLTAIDERARTHREGQPPADFTMVYHLCSLDRNEDVRVKVALHGEKPSIRTVADIWPNADWYEREVWDMFGIVIDGHPHLKRILTPPWWEGHPLRKEHPARATEMEPFKMTSADAQRMLSMMEFNPEEWGMKRSSGDHQYMFVNIGPQHPATHGILRLTVQLDGEEIIDMVPEIGFHHRGAEKMGERQTWHTYIPYTDRIDYLGGLLNNFPYVLAVEKLAGIQVPERAQVIRIMMAELFRVISHLVFYGTFSGDTGQMSPVFWLFTDRERAFDIVEAVTGGRMHPAWFRIGGVAQDLPTGWDGMMGNFIKYMRRRLKDYDATVLNNSIFKARTKGIGTISKEEAIAWGGTGPFLRGSGVDWDLRKKKPYGGYDRFEFDVPLGVRGDSWDRLDGAHGGDPPEPADHGAVPEEHAGRATTSPTTPWQPRPARSGPCTTSRPSSRTSSA